MKTPQRTLEVQRPPFWIQLSITSGNLVQLGGILLGCSGMYTAAHLELTGILRVSLTVLGWLLVYLCCHSLFHWLVGRLVGIRFSGYGVRGTDHPQDLSPIMRSLLSRVPMFTAKTRKESMRRAKPVARALMFAAGESASILWTVLAGLYAWRSHIPGGGIILAVAAFLAVIGVISTTQMPRGDYAKAIRALREGE